MAAPNGSIPNGSAAPGDTNGAPAVVGINFGNSYASIAVLAKRGEAECIANEDGERQIACAVAFHGEEMYLGNQAKHQLVKNSQNTITGFRNLLGKKFSEIPQSKITLSAPVIQHPTEPDVPAYRVQILQPAPSPLPPSSVAHTPAASNVATPRSEPVPAERVLSVSEVTTIFLKSLLQSAEDFLGKKVTGAVISVPAWFDAAARDALSKAAEDAGIHVLQLLDEAGAISVCTIARDVELETGATSEDPTPADRTALIVDVGASALELSLVSFSQGLAAVLHTSTVADGSVGGDALDSALVRFFAKDFTKKTKTPLAVAPSTEPQDRRAEVKLRLAIEHTKRTLSASPGAATCSVESLKEGLDYTGSINRLRFDMEARAVYAAIGRSVQRLLEEAGVDGYAVDEVVYVGGSACLPGVDESLADVFHEDVRTPFKAGTVVGGGIGDPTTVLARGCVLQAELLTGLASAGGEKSEEIGQAFVSGSPHADVKTTSRTIGLLVPAESPEGTELGGVFIPLVRKETPLPARRRNTFAFALSSDNKVGFELWEVNEGIKVDRIKLPAPEPEEGEEPEEEEEEEYEEVKSVTLAKERYLGSVVLEGVKGKEVNVEVTVYVSAEGSVEVKAREQGEGGQEVSLSVGA